MISVIVAVYNTPINDLKRCFESILAQTYSKFELIVVDDGSKNEIAEYIDDFAKRDKRFQVYHIKNSGVSHARNLGLKFAKGEYVTFCDSDDSLEKYFFQNSLKLSMKYNLDMIVGGVIVKDGLKQSCQCCKKPVKDIWLYTDKNALLDFALTGYPQEKNKELGNMLIARVYPKLYKKELARSVRFKEEIRMSEDNLYSFEIISKCHRIGITDECWYVYYQNEYSLTHHNDGIIEKRQAEQGDFAKEIEKMKALGNVKLDNAYNIRLFHIFINYFYALAFTVLNITKLRTTLNSAWGKAIRNIDLSSYYSTQPFDKKFQYMLGNTKWLYFYFIVRCVRWNLGRIKRKIYK